MYSNMGLDFDDGGEGEGEMVIHLTQASCESVEWKYLTQLWKCRVKVSDTACLHYPRSCLALNITPLSYLIVVRVQILGSPMGCLELCGSHYNPMYSHRYKNHFPNSVNFDDITGECNPDYQKLRWCNQGSTFFLQKN